MVSASSPLIEFSTNGRGYAMMFLLTVWLFYFAARVKETNLPRHFAGWVICGALGMYTIPVMLYPIGISGLWLLLCVIKKDLEPNPRKFLTRLCLAGCVMVVVTLLLYMPVFLGLDGLSGVTSNTFVKSLSYPELWRLIGERGPELWRLWHRNIPGLMQGVMLALFIASVVFRSRSGLDRVNLSYPAVIFGIGFTLSRRVFPFARVSLFFLPFYLAGVSAGLIMVLERFASRIKLPHDRFFAVLSIVWVALFGLLEIHNQSVARSQETGSLPDAQGITETLKWIIRPDDKVFAPSDSDGIFGYYFGKNGIPPLIIFGGLPEVGRIFLVVDGKENDLIKMLAAADKSYILTDVQELPMLIKKYPGGAGLYVITPKKPPIRLREKKQLTTDN
jgi:hypothetical protein